MRSVQESADVFLKLFLLVLQDIMPFLAEEGKLR